MSRFFFSAGAVLLAMLALQSTDLTAGPRSGGSSAVSRPAGNPPAAPTQPSASFQPRSGSRPTTTTARTSVTSERPKPTISPQQQANLQKIQSDLLALKGQSQVTTEQKTKMATDLQTLAEGTVKPSQESVQKLSNDLSQAMADSSLSKSEQAKLMQDVTAVLNSANIPPAELKTVIADAQAILGASGVDQDDVKLIVSDLQAIGKELQKNAATVKERIPTSPSSTQRRTLPGRR